ncbi:peptidase M30-like protein [Hypnocyclicus thermotrophus]|uniref:Peptidase M30-like protein n=1 Tax=Hypnocyclicus thermotrophus TaxID=1627895 RepID=A0AA46I5K6_9FUSO|nr:hypothetical protein [Hypnocyclicus thermotrophus]TDT68601.1 peptidase M30-like protein [Hypnocyclicus thermotrophus]
MKKILFYLASILVFSSCGIFDFFTESVTSTATKKAITLSIDNNSNSAYEAYAIFTNEEYYSYAGQIKITSNNINSSLNNYMANYNINTLGNDDIIKHPVFYNNGKLIREKSIENTISYNIRASITNTSYTEGSKEEFYALYAGTGDYYKENNELNKKQATLKKQVNNIEVKVENNNSSTRTLNIWVADDVWETVVTQEMIDALADKFLKTGFDNDIYDWVTNIYGDEWFEGNDEYTNTIDGNKEINILIYNINEGNNSNGSYLGFFDSTHNFINNENNKYSNEKIMFFIDSGNLAKKDENSNWDITYVDKEGKGPAIILSTLAHEFTHMIIFYQKYYNQDINIDSWINEMCAMTTEDILANKLGINNPINIRQDEFSLYSNSYPVNEWTNSTLHYANKYFFGAFLLRNFGVGIFHDIATNEYNGITAIEKALEKNGYNIKFEELLKYWGEAILTSDKYELDYVYSSKDLSYNGITYRVAPINVVDNKNYKNIIFYGLDDSSAPDLDLGANIYYKLTPYSIVSDSEWDITIPSGVGINIIIKDSLGNFKTKEYFEAEAIKNNNNFILEIK